MRIGLAQRLLLLAVQRKCLFKMLKGLARVAAAVQGQPEREMHISLPNLVVTLLEAYQGSLTVFSGLLPVLSPDERLRHAQHCLSIAAHAIQLLELPSSSEEGVRGVLKFALRQARLGQG